MNLAIIACHFNPAGYKQSRRNFLRFLRQMEAEEAPIISIELAYDDEPWLLPEAPQVCRIRTRRSQAMWHKENLINIAERSVPKEFDAIAWLDVDIWFQDIDWYQALAETLEEFPVVQVFDKALLTGEDGQVEHVFQGAAAAGELTRGTTSGFGWAARRSLWSEGGGLYDKAIIGGGDSVNGMVWLPTDEGQFDWLNYKGLAKGLSDLKCWFQEEGGRCGFVEGNIWHEWHGSLSDRQYIKRHELVKDLDVKSHLQYRDDGLLEFRTNTVGDLGKKVSHYFFDRNEDADHVSLVERPWMDDLEIECLDSVLRNTDKCLEYGSGGSSLWLSRRVKLLHSIEHNQRWAAEITKRAPSNMILHWRRPDTPYTEYEAALQGQFDSYLAVVDSLQTMFDVCVVDGRARIEAAIKVAPWIKPKGVLFFHDWFTRPRYTSRVKELEKFYEFDEDLSIDTTKQTMAVFRRK